MPDEHAPYTSWNSSICDGWFNKGDDIYTEKSAEYDGRIYPIEKFNFQPNTKILKQQHKIHIYHRGILRLPASCTFFVLLDLFNITHLHTIVCFSSIDSSSPTIGIPISLLRQSHRKQNHWNYRKCREDYYKKDIPTKKEQ